MSERLENMGKRAELKVERARLVTECDSLRSSLRRALPPEEEAANLDRDNILNLALALNQSLAELMSIDKKIGVLSDVLGGI